MVLGDVSVGTGDIKTFFGKAGSFKNFPILASVGSDEEVAALNICDGRVVHRVDGASEEFANHL